MSAPSKKPRVLLLDCAPFCGGAQESFWSLALALFEQGNPVLLLSADQSRFGLLNRARQAGLPHIGFQCRHWPCSPQGLLQFLRDRRDFAPLFQRSLEDFKPELIHANTLRSALLLNKQLCLDVPLLLHDRDLKTPLLSAPLLAARITALVAVSAAVAQKWRKLLPAEKIHVVYNGLPLPDEEAKEKRPGFCVLLLADLLAWKNHRLFLQVLQRLSGRIPGLRAIIRGRLREPKAARLLQELKRQAQALNLDSLLEIRSGEGDARSELQEADLLVSCSEQEAFGRNIIEALACGKVVVAVKAAGPAEILAHCPAASLCPPDARALAQAIIDWHEGQKYLLAAEEARKFASKFSVPRHLQNINHIYNKICKTENSKRRPARETQARL